MAVPCLGGNVLRSSASKASILAAPLSVHTNTHVQNHAAKYAVRFQPSQVLSNFGLIEQTKNALLGISTVKRKFPVSVTQVRNFVQSSKQNQINNQEGQQKPLPRLLYIQNPLVWFSNKMDFLHLRSVDPGFTEKEFARGVRQAVSRVTQLISMNMFDHMKPLFTKGGLLTLRRDVEIIWSDDLKRNIALDPHDVQLIIPRKLHFRDINGNKLCDVDVVLIGLKHLEKKENSPLIFLDIISRFHRNYTEGVVPDWSIAAFKVRKYNIMPTKNR